MHETKKRFANIQQGALSVVLVVACLFLLGYLVFGQVVLGSERIPSIFDTQSIDDGWSLSVDGADQGKIDVPTRVDVGAGETMSLTRALPAEIADDYCLQVWVRGQDVWVYIDGELRNSFTYDDLKTVGLDQPYLYLYTELDSTDAGKLVELRFSSRQSSDAGKLGDVYIGTKASLVISSIQPYLFENVSSLLLIMFAVIAIVASVVLSARSGRREPLWLLGIAILITALWVMADSRIRQFVFPNSSTIRDVAFMLATLAPLPFALYINRLQSNRHHKALLAPEVLSVAWFVVMVALHLSKAVAISVLFTPSMLIILLSIVVIVITVVSDLRHNRLGEYRFAYLGLLLFAVCAMVQLGFYAFDNGSWYSSIFLAVGMLLAVVFAVIQTIYDYAQLQESHEHALHKAQVLTKEVVVSLARTVDAKDTYTSGHSNRVAEYSRELALGLGMSADEAENIYQVALLHDMGKIGVPDEIINKTSSLTDEEFEIIKSHTKIGSEIVENMGDEIPHIMEGVRWHHERYDGKGYPDGLAGEEIPLAARIIGVADSYDAMSSNRSYRQALPQDVVRREIEQGAGTQFDPKIAALMLELIDEDTAYNMREK